MSHFSKLADLINEIECLKDATYDSPQFIAWDLQVTKVLKNSFGYPSDEVNAHKCVSLIYSTT